MFNREDTTYNDTREKSYFQWLSEMERHDDIAVRDGVRLARDYVEYLKKENARLKEENELKNRFLKQMKEKNRSISDGNR